MEAGTRCQGNGGVGLSPPPGAGGSLPVPAPVGAPVRVWRRWPVGGRSVAGGRGRARDPGDRARRAWDRPAALAAQARQAEALQRMAQVAHRGLHQNQSVDSEGILSMPLSGLAQGLRNGSLAPEAVLHTYLNKAWQVNKDINCVTDYLDECESQLEEVKKQKARGLLYGVPVSIKECFAYQGHDSTLGLSKYLGEPDTEDSVVVQVLKKQGAIPFVKTNVPQSMFSFDCSNVLFGRTLNPWNPAKTPGGSSGGEGALIAAGGSILGLGTDIGGSIRFPSSFCGICGFKPTGDRISRQGLKGCVYGQKSVNLAVGPMARDVDSLALCMRALLCEDMFSLDPTVPPVPFNEKVYASTQPLRIGYYQSDNFTMPSPAMERAVLETKQRLEDAGHTLVPFLPEDVPSVMQDLAPSGLFSDGGETFLENFKGDQVDSCLSDLVLILKIPNWLKWLLALFIKPLAPRMSSFLNNMRARSARDLWKVHHEIKEYRHSIITQWKKENLDVVLCPMLGPALSNNYPGKATGAVSYTMLYNCLDFPAGVVPVSNVTQQDEDKLAQCRGYFLDIWDKMFQKGLVGSVGLPVAVQCVALPWHDEACLRLMREVERLSPKIKPRP
ncbi:fatty-acid amide hydrolase 1 [Tachyglossus aculeatus]|uniref:fatty-acid amide hydrolase 1 n=1 Tax=Tachyglossus aculeatus TaxID=9261 RepID=UPI0018F6880F|nr:fatty-acid amide hydrolase 1 [Tachyglossus aculeatus]